MRAYREAVVDAGLRRDDARGVRASVAVVVVQGDDPAPSPLKHQEAPGAVDRPDPARFVQPGSEHVRAEAVLHERILQRPLGVRARVVRRRGVDARDGAQENERGGERTARRRHLRESWCDEGTTTPVSYLLVREC